MSEENTLLKSVATATPKLVQLLTPLTPEGRQRAIISAMAIFGEVPSSTKTSTLSDPSKKSGADDNFLPVGDGICPKAVAWMKKNQITQEQLEHVFSIDGDAIEIIATQMPANERKEQVVQAYILCGVANFLKTGDLSFSDKDAREFCGKSGCYDHTNHSKSFKSFKNLVSGSKDTGWKITNPGLAEGVKIIKLLTPKTPE